MVDRRYLHPLDRRQVKALYHLKRLTKRPMTQHLREAVDRYLAMWGGHHAAPERSYGSTSSATTHTGRTTWYTDAAEIQDDLDRFLAYYNLQRSSPGLSAQGPTCTALGRTPDRGEYDLCLDRCMALRPPGILDA